MREEKKILLEDIERQLDSRPSFVLVSYNKFAAEPTYQFRTDVLNAGGDIEVVPKRLLLKAAKNLSLTVDELPGHIAVVFTGEDSVETAKVVANIEKSSEKAVQVLSGFIDGALFSASDVKKLAEMPSKDELRAQLLSVFMAPAQQTVSTMNSLLTSVLYCLDEKVKKESEVIS